MWVAKTWSWCFEKDWTERHLNYNNHWKDSDSGILGINGNPGFYQV